MSPFPRNFTNFVNDYKSPEEELCFQLSTLLASSYCLTLKTQKFHWNVVGQNFNELHTLFKEMYDDLFLFVDVVAEKIRTKNVFIKASLSEFAKNSRIKDEFGFDFVPSEMSANRSMCDALITDNNIMIQVINCLIETAKECKDEGLIATLSERLNVHSKFIWKLTSLLQ